MSISGSLSNALSGLTAVGRAAETVSSNISNSLTEGYGRRELVLTQGILGNSGAGVRVSGVIRHSDPVLLGNRRIAEARLGQIDVLTNFLGAAEQAIGSPDDPGSLNGRMSEFEANIIQAASRPDAEARLQSVAEAARSVANHLNAASDEIQNQRLAADRQISQSVDLINSSLQQIATLNAQILRIDDSTRDASALLDNRQKLIDDIAELVPLREVPRDNGSIALFTPGGAILLDGAPAELEFSPVGLITPDMTLASGALSGLTVNGKSVSTAADNGPIAGGRLAGLFDIRDDKAPAVQARLDAVARDLIERFEDPAVDPSLNPGDPGLFTDNGLAVVPADEIGLAGRISLNALVDPSAGGALWRVRDGLGATGPGNAGDATLLNALSDALSANRLPASGDFSVPHSASGIAADLLSGVSVTLQFAESDRTFAQSHADSLIGLELQNGVDTDQEMQKLLLIEQAFSANARVIATIDDLIQTLLRI